MKRAIIIAIAIHFGLLLAAGYIYVMRPEKKEEVFRAFLHAEKVAPMKKIRTAPPKKELKKTPAVRPLRRERPIELIAVKRAITSAFTVKLPGVSGGAYSPQIALVSVPEPTLAPERLPSFWEREIELKGRAIQLESFGVTTLKPLGTTENPIVRMIITFIPIGTASYEHQVGICYPQRKLLADNPKFQTFSISVGPYAVRPEEVIFYIYVKDTGCTYLSTNSSHCIVESVGYNVIRYTWEDREEGIESWDTMDICFTVTFMGAEGW